MNTKIPKSITSFALAIVTACALFYPAYHGDAAPASVQIAGQEIQDANARDITDLAQTPKALTDAATITISLDQAKVFTVTLAGNRTIDFVGHKAGRVFRMLIKQDATGSRTLTWDSEVRWSGGTGPTLTTTAARTDVIQFVDTGTRYIGTVVVLNINEA